MNQQLTPVQVISKMDESFNKVNTFHMDFKKEALFANQSLIKNKRLNETAQRNQGSLKHAILNVAAIGISLNPALHDAYLVPRDGAVCLDISYKGLIKIATESGAIKWVKAEVVYDADTFVYKGPATPPEHEADPFSTEKGNIKGVYCIAKTKDNDILVEVMSAADLLKIKQSSPAYKANSGPWVSFEGEMSKKAVIKRSSKTWPRVEIDDRLREAVQMLNESEGYEFSEEKEVQGGYRVDTETLALVAPSATKMIELAESGNHWDFGVLCEGLNEKEERALYTAKSKGGYFNAQDKSLHSDLKRKFYTDVQVIQDSITGSIDVISTALSDGDEYGLTEAVNELDSSEFYVLQKSFNEEQNQTINKVREV